MRFIPLLLCISIFIAATVGFFKTGGKAERIYGACSIGSVICGIVQLAILL